MIAQRVLPALALLSVAAAQSICSATGTATITNQAQATEYAGCSSIRGSILIHPDATGDIAFDGPEEIGGDLVSFNATSLKGLSSTTITSIGGAFNLTKLVTLSTLNFPVLEEVEELLWDALDNLDVLAFTSNITKADKVIIGNTFLSTLNGINLATVGVLEITNNKRLKEFSSDLGNVTDSLVIGNNGKDLAVSLPELKWAAVMTFRNVSSVTFPKLESVNGTLGLYGNFFESIKAPKLTKVGQFNTGAGGLAVVANAQLTELDMPLLKSVGGAYQIANNTELVDIDFPALESVGGAVDFSGNFKTPKLEKLKDVRGGFNMQSKSDIDCSNFESLRSNNVIQGTFVCKSSADDAKSADGTTTDGSGTSTGGSGAAASDKPGAAATFGAGPAVVGLSVLAGLMSMLL